MTAPVVNPVDVEIITTHVYNREKRKMDAVSKGNSSKKIDLSKRSNRKTVQKLQSLGPSAEKVVTDDVVPTKDADRGKKRRTPDKEPSRPRVKRIRHKGLVNILLWRRVTVPSNINDKVGLRMTRPAESNNGEERTSPERGSEGVLDGMRTDQVIERRVVLPNGDTEIVESQLISKQPVPVGLTFYTVHVSDEMLDWATNERNHTNDLTASVAMMIRACKEPVMKVFGIDYNSVRRGLGLGPIEINNILKRAVPIALGLPKCVLSMWKTRVTRYKIRIIPVWGIYALLANLPKHVMEIQVNPLVNALSVLNQMIGGMFENDPGDRKACSQAMSLLETSVVQYQDQLRALVENGMNGPAILAMLADVRAANMKLQASSTAALSENIRLKKVIEEMRGRIDDLERFVDEDVDDIVERKVAARMEEEVARIKEEIRIELLGEIREMLARSQGGMGGYYYPPPVPMSSMGRQYYVMPPCKKRKQKGSPVSI